MIASEAQLGHDLALQASHEEPIAAHEARAAIATVANECNSRSRPCKRAKHHITCKGGSSCASIGRETDEEASDDEHSIDEYRRKSQASPTSWQHQQEHEQQQQQQQAPLDYVSDSHAGQQPSGSDMHVTSQHNDSTSLAQQHEDKDIHSSSEPAHVCRISVQACDDAHKQQQQQQQQSEAVCTPKCTLAAHVCLRGGADGHAPAVSSSALSSITTLSPAGMRNSSSSSAGDASKKHEHVIKSSALLSTSTQQHADGSSTDTSSPSRSAHCSDDDSDTHDTHFDDAEHDPYDSHEERSSDHAASQQRGGSSSSSSHASHHSSSGSLYSGIAARMFMRTPAGRPFTSAYAIWCDKQKALGRSARELLELLKEDMELDIDFDTDVDTAATDASNSGSDSPAQQNIDSDGTAAAAAAASAASDGTKPEDDSNSSGDAQQQANDVNTTAATPPAAAAATPAAVAAPTATASAATKDLGTASEWSLLESLMAFRNRAKLHVLASVNVRPKLPQVNTIQDVCELLRSCNNILVLTGAGISVSSGIPDFRSENGIYNMLGEYNLPSPQAMFDRRYFETNPVPFFQFAKQLLPGSYKPSATHRFIQMLDAKGKLLRNYTQNIDGLEKQAGVSGDKIHQCHGSLDTATCLQCRACVPLSVIEEDIKAQTLPICTACDHPGNILKPDIVFFGEPLGTKFADLLLADRHKCDLVIVMGSSLQVAPVNQIIGWVPRTVPQLLINREVVGQPHKFDVQLLGDSDAIVATLCDMLSNSTTITAADEASESDESAAWDLNAARNSSSSSSLDTSDATDSAIDTTAVTAAEDLGSLETAATAAAAEEPAEPAASAAQPYRFEAPNTYFFRNGKLKHISQEDVIDMLFDLDVTADEYDVQLARMGVAEAEE